jgi:tetratricopeptide (TPR) repeat protein
MKTAQARTQLFLYLSAAATLAAVFFCSLWIHSGFKTPFPPVNQLIFDIGSDFSNVVSYDEPLGAEGGYRDFAGVLSGMRRLTAEVAWLAILQYYGSHEFAEEPGGGEHHHTFGGGDYRSIKRLTLRIMRLDPSMHYGVLYGAGALGWNLDRPQEAMEILEEAAQRNPTYWQYHLYIEALVYKQKGELDGMIVRLEAIYARYRNDCPTMFKSVLAGIHKDRRHYKRALEIWIDIAETTKDPGYIEMSKKQIPDLCQKLGIPIPQ